MTTNEDWRALFESPLHATSPDIARLLSDQQERDSATVNLVASESYCPRATLEAEASILVNKNATGYPGKRAIGGGEILDAIEGLAIDRAKRLFGAEHANIQSLSSTIANVAVLRALLGKGDRILSFDMAAGGHVSHGGGTHISGQDYRVETFGVDEESGAIDFSTARRMAERFRPHIIVAGSSSYPRRIDYRALHDIATDNGAILFADIAHVAGLVVSGHHPNPAPFADVVTTSTHMIVVDLRRKGWTGAALNAYFSRHGVTANATRLPALTGARSQLGLRLGTVAMTLRGADGDGFRRIGEMLARLLKGDPEGDDDHEIAQIVKGIAERHPLPDTLGS